MRLLNNFQRYGKKERERSKNFDFSRFAIFGFLFTEDRTSSRFEVKRDEMGVEDGYCIARFVSSISSSFPLRSTKGGRKSLVSGEEQAMMPRKKYRRDRFQRVESWASRVPSVPVIFFFLSVKYKIEFCRVKFENYSNRKN